MAKTGKAYFRPIIILTLTLIVLAAVQAIPPVRNFSASILRIFREQKTSGMPINPTRLPEQLGETVFLHSLFASEVNYKENGLGQEVDSVLDAQTGAGFPVRFPQANPAPSTIFILPGGEVNFTIDTQRLAATLVELEDNTVQTLSTIEQTRVILKVPASVLTQYGNCTFDRETAVKQGYDPDDPTLARTPECTSLLQMCVPEIQAPPGLDLKRIGAAFLLMLGVNPDKAPGYASIMNWNAFLILPVPRYASYFEQIEVDGVTGTIFVKNDPITPDQYLLTWVKDGIFYALTGPGDEKTALGLVDSLE